jgi:hypothetical protein
MILIFDIDETLIHSVKALNLQLHEDAIDRGDAFQLFDYVVYKRPYLDDFIQRVTNDPYYSAGVWSAGSYDYVHGIVDHIFPNRDDLEFVMTVRDCNELKDKPLSKVRDIYHQQYLQNPDIFMEPTVHDFLIIDDRDGVTGHDELNHLKIYEFLNDDDDDNELERLWYYLDANRGRTSEYLASNWR